MIQKWPLVLVQVEHNIPSALILEDDFDLHHGKGAIGRFRAKGLWYALNRQLSSH